VRLDSGVEEGGEVVGAFDSMLAKLVVSGASRQQALERSRRALAEFVVDGMPTVLPFHRVVVSDPAFAPADPAQPFTIHTRWIETEFDNTVEPYAGVLGDGVPQPAERERVVVEVGGRRLEVVLPAGFGAGTAPTGRSKPARRSGGGKAGAAASGDALTSPMQGTIVKVVAENGQIVAAGDPIVVLEAMKMEQPLTAHKAGTVSGLSAEVGATVANGEVIAEIKD
jgi:acetyl-CoA/propionyl-CoA carboxylase biotin carboxyl carrier protein